ncbi:MAG: hypothetical protein FWH36_05575 [Lentimicrobiaceae bacterium]|nr:hypothetical protein [Lentimicrobiaceae bacterium]
MSRQLFFTAVFLAAGFVATAKNDSIQFTWNVSYGVSFDISAVQGEQFTIHWGDWEETFTSTGTAQQLTHMYNGSGEFTVKITSLAEEDCFLSIGVGNKGLIDLDIKSEKMQVIVCSNNQLVNLNLNCPILRYLDCSNNQLTNLNVETSTQLTNLNCSNNLLTTLDLSNVVLIFSNLYCSDNQLTVLKPPPYCMFFFCFECNNNRFLLSDLYVLCEHFNMAWREVRYYLGIQRLTAQTVKVNDTIDFSAQRQFDNIATVFIVEKNDTLADSSTYNISNGIITFKDTGYYTVTMTNLALPPYVGTYTKVIAEFEVLPQDDTTSIKEQLRVASCELRVTSYELRVANRKY